MYGVTLAALPPSGKVFCTLFLLGIGCGALAAVVQAATAVGLTPAEVQASLAPEMPMTHLGHGPASAEREIALGEVSRAAKVWIRTPLLIQTSHTHLFGQTLIAGLLGLIFLFATLPERFKALIIALPFAGTVLDIGGMWLTRFVWPDLAVLVLVGGSLFALGYLAIAAISLWQLWAVRGARP
ncbi:MAG TPA: hypothetical protein VNK50_11060 [Calidithermus sp.]|nr:hypothetical protein [Calidithermus sp.]